jgi:hypothetical protein
MVNGHKRTFSISLTASGDYESPNWNGIVGKQVSLTGEVDEVVWTAYPGEGPRGTTLYGYQNNPLPGVNVQLFSSPSTPAGTYTTDENGNFWFSVTSSTAGVVYYQAILGDGQGSKPSPSVPKSNVVLVHWWPALPTTLTLEPVGIFEFWGESWMMYLQGNLTDINGDGVTGQTINLWATPTTWNSSGNFVNTQPPILMTSPTTGYGGAFQAYVILWKSESDGSDISYDNIQAKFLPTGEYLGSESATVAGLASIFGQ